VAGRAGRRADSNGGARPRGSDGLVVPLAADVSALQRGRQRLRAAVRPL